MRVIGFVAGLCLALSAGAALADCPSDAPLGLFQGAVGGKGTDRTEIILNLVCADGGYSGQAATSIGDFRGTDTGSGAGHARLAMDRGGKLDLTLTGDTLSGPFRLGFLGGPLTLTRAGPARPPSWIQPTLALTTAQWREDLKAFAEEVPKRHLNAYATLEKADFDAQVAALDRRLPRMGPDEVFVNFVRLANQIGDGHTGVPLPPERALFPLQLARFGREVRVVAVGPGLERALGARVVAIGPTPIETAWTRAMTLTPRDELPTLRDGRAADVLTRGLLLHGLKITPARESAVFTLVDDRGRRFKQRVTALPATTPPPPFRPAAGKRGLADENPDKSFWCQEVAASALYCQFRGYQDLKARAAEMFALIDKSHPAKLVLDMRDNGGGDNTEGYRWLILPMLERHDLNRKGRLYVLVSGQTFSAAMNNAAQFQDRTAATLVGEPIGEKPNSYQEPRQFHLPNSHLVVRVSTRYYKFKEHGPNAVTPDKVIVPTWSDVKAGRDPVLDWVLAQPVPAS